MTIEKVLNVFSGYLKQNTAVEVVETARGHVVMIWDSPDEGLERCLSLPHRQSTDEHAAQLQRSFRRGMLYARRARSDGR